VEFPQIRRLQCGHSWEVIVQADNAMTAGGDGKRPEEDLAPISVRERRPVPERPVPERPGIFPLRGEPGRDRQMQATWQSFGGDMGEAVRAVLAGGRSPPEIAYAIGEIVHNYFRTRGVTLTSYELRRRVADLLVQHGRDRHALRASGPLVTFDREPAETGAGSAAAIDAAEPVAADAACEPPPSALVAVSPRDDDAALLADATARVRARLDGDLAYSRRSVVVEAIQAVLRQAVPDDADRRQRLVRLMLVDLCGLGPIERLWADRSVRAIFVNGPALIQVERNGVIETSSETFRDQAHWLEVAVRLARRPRTGAASAAVPIRLRDGSEGVVLFAPAAPAGPVAVLRRAPPGEATFEHLIAMGCLDGRMADLLRIAARSRLNVLVTGPDGSGKTALLAAIARDFGDGRIATLARDRTFDWPSSSKVELVAVPQAPFATMLAAGAQLRPDLLLACGSRGIVAAGEPSQLVSLPCGAIDLTVRLQSTTSGLFVVAMMEDASGAPLFAYEIGEFHRRTDRPSFVRDVLDAGYGEALSSALR
jgi:hypothetical protein